MAADAKLLAQIELVGDIDEWIVDAVCDPTCDAYRGPNGGGCSYCTAKFIADKLAAAGRLLPSGGEISTQTVWSRFGQSTAGTRQVITWPDGSRYVGPFVPDPPLTPEEIEAMRAVVWERVRRTLPNGGRPVLSETSEGESGA